MRLFPAFLMATMVPALRVGLALSMLALAGAAPATASVILNNLQQIALSTHDGATNNLKQIGLSLHGGHSFVAGDGSVRTIPDDGSVRFVAVGSDSSASLCFHHVHVPGNITDGTSNTIAFSESVGLQVTPGFVTGPHPIRDILDGTSNTIFFGETPNDELCLGNTLIGDPVIGNFTDGTSNTIVFGENSDFDICFNSARVTTIADGTSNTLLFGETQNGLCFENVQVAGDLTVTGDVPEPGSLALLLTATLGLVVLRRRGGSPR
jgi:hypothetical protein